MLICCWSAKGGTGTTVVATALASLLASASPIGALLVDLAGDVPAVVGLPDDESTPGVSDWLHEGPSVPADGLARLEIALGRDLSLVPRGSGPLRAERSHALASILTADPRPVVVDAGVIVREHVSAVIAAAAVDSFLVTRACFLSLRRALAAPVQASAVVLVVEEGRSLTAGDVEAALGLPVRAEVTVTAQVARAVDAGVLLSRLPRSLVRELRHAA